ncbi:hypothetical protein ACFX1T_005451 [Malus domestica]
MIDAFAGSQGIAMNTVQCKAILGQGFVGEVPVFLAKPQTYMNLRGESRLRAINATGYVTNVTTKDISAWFNLYLSFVKLQTGPLAAYKLSLNLVLVFHDDMTLQCGVLCLYPNGGHVDHNGLKSVIYHFRGNREFPRLRIGEFEFPNFMSLNDLFPVLESMLNFLPGIGRRILVKWIQKHSCCKNLMQLPKDE